MNAILIFFMNHPRTITTYIQYIQCAHSFLYYSVIYFVVIDTKFHSQHSSKHMNIVHRLPSVPLYIDFYHISWYPPLQRYPLIQKLVCAHSSSVVLYASEIYGHNDLCIKKLEIFQRFLYKKALKLSKSTPRVMIYGETGTTPLHVTIEKRMIGYWLQILMGSSNKLNYQIYK